ncbi:268_t:CDS:2, partial [Funneliformis geosporum]
QTLDPPSNDPSDGLNELLNNTNDSSNKNTRPKRTYKKWQTAKKKTVSFPSSQIINDLLKDDDPKKNDNGPKDDEVLNKDLDDDFHHHFNEDLNDDDYHSNEDGLDNEVEILFNQIKLRLLDNQDYPLNRSPRPESRTNGPLDYTNQTSRLARLTPLRSMDNSMNVLPNASISSHFNTIGQLTNSMHMSTQMSVVDGSQFAPS